MALVYMTEYIYIYTYVFIHDSVYAQVCGNHSRGSTQPIRVMFNYSKSRGSTQPIRVMFNYSNLHNTANPTTPQCVAGWPTNWAVKFSTLGSIPGCGMHGDEGVLVLLSLCLNPSGNLCLGFCVQVMHFEH